METLAEMEAVGNADFSDGYIPARAYKKTDDRRTDYINFVGAAGGWGGAMIREDISQDGQPNIIPTRESNTTNRFNVLMRH